MSVRLTITMRGEAGGADKPKIVVLTDEVITLGRGDKCDVQLAQQAVSREHARITRDDTLFFLQDLGSAYGTTVNGKKLDKDEKKLLTNGDTIAIAQFDVVFDRVAAIGTDDEGKPNPGHTAFISAHVVRKVIKGVGQGEEPYLRVMNGPLEGKRVPIASAQEYFVGRDNNCDIVLQDDLVSRRHVKIRRDWAGVSIEDLGSRNGIKVNKKKVKRVTLKDRDAIQIGSVQFLFVDPSEIRDAPVVMAGDEEHTHTVNDEAEEPQAPKAAPLPEKSSAGDEGQFEEPPNHELSGVDEPPPEEPPADEGEPEEPPPEDEPPEDSQASAAMAMPDDDDPPAQEGGINVRLIVALGVVTVLVIFGIVVLVLLFRGG